MEQAVWAKSSLLILSHCKLSENGSYHYYSNVFALKYIENCTRLTGRKGEGIRGSAMDCRWQGDKGAGTVDEEASWEWNSCKAWLGGK